jgi:CheY-like chemotaxis protein
MIMTTYIIDDDEVYVMGVKRMLAKTNLSDTVLVFENGLKALEYISDSTHEVPDTILLDINMPVMDGWQFLDGFSKVKNGFNKKVTIYMVSSSINPVDLARAKSYSDVTDYIFKPITTADLQRLLVH